MTCPLSSATHIDIVLFRGSYSVDHALMYVLAHICYQKSLYIMHSVGDEKGVLQMSTEMHVFVIHDDRLRTDKNYCMT
jgi:hypothetical protein